jgi:neutral ceramidase
MGYGKKEQRGQGIHTRQFSRAFILEDANEHRLVYASVEVLAISHAMRRDVKENSFNET